MDGTYRMFGHVFPRPFGELLDGYFFAHCGNRQAVFCRLALFYVLIGLRSICYGRVDSEFLLGRGEQLKCPRAGENLREKSIKRFRSTELKTP